ncbi:MAG: hypothetical protein HOK59_10650, partial [Candidatus Marinimicrobia bacterium]|nr:hypothetical protein [Candidatus Neomarinimicrobiota bacterium]
WRILWKAKTNHAVIKNANAVMVNVPVKDVKRENPATATVIVPVVKKNAAALNKIELL